MDEKAVDAAITQAIRRRRPPIDSPMPWGTLVTAMFVVALTGCAVLASC